MNVLHQLPNFKAFSLKPMFSVRFAVGDTHNFRTTPPIVNTIPILNTIFIHNLRGNAALTNIAYFSCVKSLSFEKPHHNLIKLLYENLTILQYNIPLVFKNRC